MKYADQRFRLWYKPKKEDYRWAAGRRREKRMVGIEEREPEAEELEIFPLSVSFLKATYVMQPDKGLESLGQELSTMNINTLEEGKFEGDDRNTIGE